MDRPRTKVTRTRIYFTTHRPGAVPVLRLTNVVRRERASRSIVPNNGVMVHHNNGVADARNRRFCARLSIIAGRRAVEKTLQLRTGDSM